MRGKATMVVTIKEEDEPQESSTTTAAAAPRGRRPVGTHIPRGTVRGTMRSAGTSSTRKSAKENTPEPVDEHHAGEGAAHGKSAIPRAGAKTTRGVAREDPAEAAKARVTRVRTTTKK